MDPNPSKAKSVDLQSFLDQQIENNNFDQDSIPEDELDRLLGGTPGEKREAFLSLVKNKKGFKDPAAAEKIAAKLEPGGKEKPEPEQKPWPVPHQGEAGWEEFVTAVSA